MKYYSAILEVARVAGFDVLDDEVRLRNTLGDLFPHDKDISVDNPLLQQAMNENLYEWNDCRRVWGSQYAIIFLLPNQTTISIYEGKRLVFTHSVEQGGVDIRKAVEDILPEGYKKNATMICEKYGSVIPSSSQRLRLGDAVIDSLDIARAMRKRLDDILSEFLPILKGGDFATHLCNVVIAGEGVGVNAIQQYVQDWVIAEHGAPVVTHFLSILIAEKQEDNYIRNYYKGYEAE